MQATTNSPKVTLTGKTFDAKKQLKNYGANYNPASKTWTMAASDWAEFKASYPILASGIQVAGQSGGSAVCPCCHTVCYGDCQA